jgi:integrase
VQHRDGRYTAVLPAAVGSRTRIQFSWPDPEPVHRWYADGEQALAEGRPVPDPEGYKPAARRVLVPGPAQPVSAAWRIGDTAGDGHDLLAVGLAYIEQRYVVLRGAQAERRREVTKQLRETIYPFFARHVGGVVERIENPVVAAFAAHLAGRDVTALPVAPPWPQLDGRRRVRRRDADRLPGVSRSAITRWRRAGLLPGYETVDGEAWIPVDELRAAHLGRQTAPKTRRGLAKSTAENILGLLGAILRHAEACGLTLVGNPMAGISAVEPDDGASRAARSPKYLPLALARDVAAELSVVHQLTFWLERLVGVRIGEAFGIHVGDLVDFGPGHGGAVVLDKQGGRTFLVDRDGATVTVAHKPGMKTRQSVRIIKVAEPVMVLARLVVEAFHTDPGTGAVDLTARLIPGLQDADRGGQSAHRNALATAVHDAGIDVGRYGKITPHTLRADLITDLGTRGRLDSALKRRYVGHLAGNDEHDRSYFRDRVDITPQAMAVWDPIVETIEARVHAELGGSLLVPTERREQFGLSHPLQPRLGYAYATLAAAGWSREAQTDDNSTALLSPEQAAQLLGCAPVTARRWMREGRLPARLVTRGNRQVWVATVDDVQAYVTRLRDTPTITDFANELGLTYHQLYGLMRQLGIAGEQAVRGGDIRLNANDVAAIRAELDRRARLAQTAMPVAVAAERLRLPVLTIETLLRQGVLHLDSEATSPRRRCVTTASVEAYERKRACSSEPLAEDGAVLTLAEVRAITTLARPTITHLVTSRVFRAVMRDRRQMITVESLRAWAEASGRRDVLSLLAGS